MVMLGDTEQHWILMGNKILSKYRSYIKTFILFKIVRNIFFLNKEG